MLLHVGDALVGVEARAGLQLGVLDRLAGRFQETPFLELHYMTKGFEIRTLRWHWVLEIVTYDRVQPSCARRPE